MKKGFLVKVLGLTIALSLTMVGAAFASGYGSDAPAVVPAGGLVGGLATTDAQFDNTLVNANKTGVCVGGQTATDVIKETRVPQSLITQAGYGLRHTK